MFSKYFQHKCIDIQEILTTFSENHFEEYDGIEMCVIIRHL